MRARLASFVALAAWSLAAPALADVPPVTPTTEEQAFEIGYAGGQLLAVTCIAGAALGLVAFVALGVLLWKRRASSD